MAFGTNNEYILKVGEAVICIKCPSEDFVQSMREYLGNFNSDRGCDINLKLKIKKHFRELNVPDSMFTTKKVSGNNFIIGKKLVSGHFEPVSGKGKLSVKEVLTAGILRRVLEQVFYQAYYSACRINKHDTILLHSAGVISEGRGYLFTGASGSGKSTIANLSRDRHVLNDEICLLEFKNGKIILHGTPFNGYYREKKQGSAELHTIFIINHGNQHVISHLDKPDAVKGIAKEIIPPIALNEAMKPGIFSHMLDIAERIYNNVHIKRLDFTPDQGFWDKVQLMEED